MYLGRIIFSPKSRKSLLHYEYRLDAHLVQKKTEQSKDRTYLSPMSRFCAFHLGATLLLSREMQRIHPSSTMCKGTKPLISSRRRNDPNCNLAILANSQTFPSCRIRRTNIDTSHTLTYQLFCSYANSSSTSSPLPSVCDSSAGPLWPT